jgi:hypothetical protein
MTKYFTGKDLSGIDRVTVRQGNSYMDTIAGRQDIADKWLQAGIIKNADEYTQVMQTGRLEIPIEGEQNELMTIRMENEALMEGQVFESIWIDNHPRHILAHKYLLANPASRSDVGLVQAVTIHIQDHIEKLKTSDPFVLQILGMQALPPGPMWQNPMPTGQVMQPSGQDFSGAANPQVSSALNLPNPAESNVRPVNMPKNALTGEEFSPTQEIQ